VDQNKTPNTVKLAEISPTSTTSDLELNR
jgi:hypothetical protein